MSHIKSINSNNGYPPSGRFGIESNLQMQMMFFRIASYLTDPICKAHELYRRLQIVNQINNKSYKISNLVRKFFLLMGVIATASISIPTAILGIAFRYFGTYLQKTPYTYLKEKNQDILLQHNTFSLLSWNVCGISGGYSITDGGVMPIWLDRINKVISQILKANSDVICLYEVFDINLAIHLYQKLKKEYGHFYINIGPNVLGVSSGMFVASKYKVKNPKFLALPQNALVGRTKNSRKGIFSFDLETENKIFAKIFSVHPQQSEECAYPTEEEKQARKITLDFIQEEVNAENNKAIVVTGDMNLDDDEYSSLKLKDLFEKKVEYNNKFTWGGDRFCATLVKKRVSPPLNLDHTIVKRDSVRSITTSLLETFYDDTKIDENALSDHCGLISKIILN